MFKYIIAFNIILLAAILYVVTHSQKEAPDVDIVYAMPSPIKTMDPAAMSLSEEIRISIGLWDNLFTYEPKTSVSIEGVAYYPADISKDYKTWTFHLRPEAKWSNGDQVTSHDFIYGWRRAIEPGTADDYAYLIKDNIAGAAEYAKWRNDTVRVLTILRDLIKGRDISEEDRQILNDQNFEGVNSPEPDWLSIADKFRQNHLDSIESEFAKLGLKAIDDLTLEVKLSRPLTYFDNLVPFSTFCPIHRQSCEMMRIKDDDVINFLTLWVYDPQWVKPDYHKDGYPGLITNGPFIFKEWQFKRYMLFEKNEQYWDKDNVKCFRIMGKVTPESNSTFLAYERGEIDYIKSLSDMDFVSSLYKDMKAGKRNDVHHGDTFGNYYYQVNCNEFLNDGRVNPFHDKRVRMAFNLAIDKQSLADNVRKIGNAPATLLIPPGIIPGYHCEQGPAYNPDRARELLAEAGYPGGEGLPSIDLFVSAPPETHKKTAQAVAVMWEKELGADVLIRVKEWKIFDEDRSKQAFMICRAGWYGDYYDPTTYLDLLVTGNGQNHSKFSNKEYDSLMQQAYACVDPEKRMEILASAEKLAMHEYVPVIPLFNYVTLEAFRPEIKGITINPREFHPMKYWENTAK